MKSSATPAVPKRSVERPTPGAGLAGRPGAKVLVVDDHEVTRRGVASVLAADPRLSVCGEAANGEEAVALATDLQPDVVVIDVLMPVMGGLEATRRIRERSPGTEVVVLSERVSDEAIRESIRSGAITFIPKEERAATLLDAVRAASRREPLFPPATAKALLHDLRGGAEAGDPLTAREREVAKMFAEGRKSREIGKLLGISHKTADVHRGNIMRKLKLRSLGELVRHAIRNRWVEA